MFAIIFWIIVALIAYAFREQLIQIAFFIGSFMAIGALIFWILFDNASLGSTIGFWVAIFIGLKLVTQSMGAEYSSIFEYAYYIFSVPVWFLNRLQHILSEPWRYMFKTSWPEEETKEILRPMLYGLQILLYIAITPLRLLNAFIYNIVIYGVTELYDLFFEVLQPSEWDEGYGDWWTWTYMLPVRIIKYPIYHGGLVLIEGAVWTVIDTIIPAITMYHGTDLVAGQAITGKAGRRWTDGTFTASQSSWGGIGVYFASRRSVARRYAEDPYRLSGSNPVMIVCRVSLGKIINYSLAPYSTYKNAGATGNPAVLNRYAENNGYNTGEWWNQRGGYWEYCLFDWQNRYNHPWRIRPIFVFNFRTGRAQHIESGLRHWLFSKVVMDDILKSTRFTCLVVFAFIVVIWFLYQLITNNLHWNYYSYSPHKTELYEPVSVDNNDSKTQEEWEEEYAIAERDFVDEVPEEPAKPEPKKVEQPVSQPVRTTYTPSYSRTSSKPKQQKKSNITYTRTSKPASSTSSTPKSGTGFRLEKVDRIPTAADIKGNGTVRENTSNSASQRKSSSTKSLEEIIRNY